MSTENNPGVLRGFRIIEREAFDGTRIQGVGTVSSRTYPFRLVRRSVEGTDGPSGKMPRFLICAITTLIVGGDGFDRAERRLSLGAGYQRLRAEANYAIVPRIANQTAAALEWWMNHPLPTQYGPLPMVEDYAWANRDIKARWVRLTPEFVEASLHNTATVPLSAFSRTGHSILATDLITLAAMTCPPDTRLRVSFGTLIKWFGLVGSDGEDRTYLMPRRWRNVAKTANSAQTRWLFTVDNFDVSVRPLMADDDCPTVRLNLV